MRIRLLFRMDECLWSAKGSTMSFFIFPSYFPDVGFSIRFRGYIQKVKGTLHPLALSFALLETQSYFWMVMQHYLIFPWDGRNPYLPLTLPSGNDGKIVILRHSQKEEGGFLLRLQTLVPPFQIRPWGVGPNALTDLSQISDSALDFTCRNPGRRYSLRRRTQYRGLGFWRNYGRNGCSWLPLWATI